MKFCKGVNRMKFNFIFLHIYIHVMKFKLNTYDIWVLEKLSNKKFNFDFFCKFLGFFFEK